MDKQALLNKKGFTLTEFILTILIIGILSAIVIPRIGGGDFFDRFKLKTVTHQLASDMRYARRLAVTNSQEYIILYLGNQTYDIQTPLGSIGKDFPKTISSEISFSGTLQYTFGVLGDSSGGTSTLTINSSSYDITVDPITGSVRTKKIN